MRMAAEENLEHRAIVTSFAVNVEDEDMSKLIAFVCQLMRISAQQDGSSRPTIHPLTDVDRRAMNKLMRVSSRVVWTPKSC